MSTEPSSRAGPFNQEWKLPESIESRYKIALTRWGIGCSINPSPPGSFLTSDGHRALFMWLAQLTEKELSIEPRPCSMSRISRLCALGGVRVSVRRLYPFRACSTGPILSPTLQGQHCRHQQSCQVHDSPSPRTARVPATLPDGSAGCASSRHILQSKAIKDLA